MGKQRRLKSEFSLLRLNLFSDFKSKLNSELDEIFISAAQVTDIEIIDEITATELQATGDVITSVNSVTTGITSATTTTSSSGGGYSY